MIQSQLIEILCYVSTFELSPLWFTMLHARDINQENYSYCLNVFFLLNKNIFLFVLSLKGNKRKKNQTKKTAPNQIHRLTLLRYYATRHLHAHEGRCSLVNCLASCYVSLTSEKTNHTGQPYNKELWAPRIKCIIHSLVNNTWEWS